MVDVDANDDEANGMRRSGRQKDERAAVESAASKRAARQVGPESVCMAAEWWPITEGLLSGGLSLRGC